jgi:hypothetical protein
MTRFGRVAGAVLGAFSVVVLAAACGSSSSGTAAGGSSGSPTAAPSVVGSSAMVSSAPPTAPPSSGGISAHVAAAPCTTSGLGVALGGSQGTAGSIIVTVTFTNSGSSSCTLSGYPGVSLTAGSPPAQVGAAAVRDGSVPVTTVTLAPGAVASSGVQITEAGNYSSSTCQPTPVTAILVYPPDQTQSVSLPYNGTGCAATGVALLHVSAIQAGNGQ